MIFTADSKMYREKKVKMIKQNPIRKDRTVEEVMEESD